MYFCRNKNNPFMLKKARLAAAIIFWDIITLLFLDFTGTLHAWFGWMARIQFLPAVLALNLGVVILLVALTLVFGRVYCSVICPLGVFQDVVSWINGRRGKKSRMRFAWSPAKDWLRYGMLAVFIAALAAGAGSVVALLAPYSTYGRIVSNLFSPVYRWGNNLLACFAERIDSYAFYTTEVWVRSVPAFIIAAAAFILIAVLAWRNGRTWCNTVCPDSSRRSFLSITAMLAGSAAVKAQEMKVDGGLAVIQKKKIPHRSTRIVPAGSGSIRNFENHCTACQLCVSVCPNQVLRPSAGIMTLMQPEMSYERGYCRPECTRCADVCPAGAILPVSAEEKSSTRIGHAVWVRENCVPLTDGVKCGNCARHCPSGAIMMVPSDASDPGSPEIPVINTEKCIGCGACEYLCPARPFSAIYVEGHQMHSEF